MEIIISEKFIDHFESEDKDAYAHHLVERVNTINKIRRLILSGLTITSDIVISRLVKSYDITGNKNYKCFKDVFCSSVIKSGKYNYKSLKIVNELENYSAYYFLEAEMDSSMGTGVIFVNDLLKTTGFFENCTVNSRSLKEDYTIIEKAAPPCNAMLYIDKYLFSSKDKVNNFVKFMSLYKSETLAIPFQLTLISSFENNNRSIPERIVEYAVTQLNKIEHLQFEILLDKRIPMDDRLIFTNYTMGSIGHPFDDRATIFNQNFMGTSNNIKGDYDNFIKNLKEWSLFKSKIPGSIGKITTQYSNATFVNRLFQNL